MSYQDNCRICGESYNEDNLMACSVCSRDVCYRCTGRFSGTCKYCSDARDVREAAEAAAAVTTPQAPPQSAP